MENSLEIRPMTTHISYDQFRHVLKSDAEYQA